VTSPSEPGLRERKKLETRRALAVASRRLAVERGVDGFTIDDVATAANVSPRTFFNYYATKEDAIVGLDPQRLAEMAASLRDRPRHESPIVALRNTLVDSVDDLEANAAGFATRTELVHRYPELMPRHLAATYAIEQALAAAMAERLGVDVAEDPYPTVVVSVAMAALRSGMLWWHANGQGGTLASLLATMFADLGRGLPRPR